MSLKSIFNGSGIYDTVTAAKWNQITNDNTIQRSYLTITSVTELTLPLGSPATLVEYDNGDVLTNDTTNFSWDNSQLTITIPGIYRLDFYAYYSLDAPTVATLSATLTNGSSIISTTNSGTLLAEGVTENIKTMLVNVVGETVLSLFISTSVSGDENPFVLYQTSSIIITEI